MENKETKKQIKSKLFLINSFLYTTSLTPKEDPESFLKHRVTSYFLQSVVMELIIKIFYEINFNKPAPFTHNVLTLFDSLTQGSKDFIELKYNEAIERKKIQFQRINDSVKFQSLRDVLVSNESIVKNFKYDAVSPRTNSSADPTFYKEILNFINKKIES